jgi:hypothetical protein
MLKQGTVGIETRKEQIAHRMRSHSFAEAA